MDTSAERTTPPGISNRQRRSVADKRRIVELTFVDGAAVARVAREHGVNANQLFQWRRQYRAGRLGGAPVAAADTIKLLPVSVAAELNTLAAPVDEAPPISASAGTIHIKLPQAQIRIEGRADPVLLKVVLESLRR